jgi:hypothetical protein
MVTVKVAGIDVPVAEVIPPGVISAFGGTTAPNGWLLCDGSAVSRTTYANLFATIGTTYGAGDGSTTFNLPDLHTQSGYGVSSWTKYTMTIGAAPTPPTKGTVTSDVAQWRRVGTDLELIYNLKQTTAGAAAGSGVYMYPLPSGLTIDTSKFVSSIFDTTCVVGSAILHTGNPLMLIGAVVVNPNISSTGVMIVVPSNSGSSPYYLLDTMGYQNNGYYQLTTILEIHLQCRVPISQWASLGQYIIKI